jgi:hypothetical protein
MDAEITAERLHDLYVEQGHSVAEIARILACSQSKINYRLAKYGIAKRSISEAIYKKKNPNGDPFVEWKPISTADWYLWGLGLGLYWGEGTKRNSHEVRLGNTDPALVNTFIQFLERFYGIERAQLRFGLHLFPEQSASDVITQWCDALAVTPSQFFKTHVQKSGSTGTYGRRAPYGVITVYFSNKKLRDRLVAEVEKLQ